MSESTFIQQNQSEDSSKNDLKSKLPKVNPIVGFFLNRRNQLTLFVWIFALSVPILCYYFLFHQQLPISISLETCSVNSTFRVSCGNFNLTDKQARKNCLDLSCCFDDFTSECFHSLPSAYFYTKDNRAGRDKSTFLTPMDPKLYVSYLKNKDNLKIKITNDENENFKEISQEETLYTIKEDSNRLQLDVFRKDTNNLLLTSTLGPIISTGNYLEVTIFLGEHLFGLDKMYFTGNETYTKVIYHNGDDHTTIPVFMAYKNGEYHSLLIEYDGPIEISVLPSRLIVLRAIGKRSIVINLHIGPTPKEITRFYYNKYSYNVPERWILGPHICRSGSKTIEEAKKIYDEFIKNTTEINLTYVSDCFDENLYFMMIQEDENDFQREIPEETKFIFTIFPHIPKSSKFYDISLENNLFYIKPNGFDPQNGTYFNLDVYYPDYSLANINTLSDSIKQLINSVNPDEYSFSNNWASDNSSVNIDNLKLVYSHENITKTFSGTLMWNSTINNIEHFYNHNSYGKNHVSALKTQSNMIFTSIFNENTIKQVENLNGTWDNMKKSLLKVFSHSIFAHPLISIPICGSTKFFNLEEQVELCTRWYMLGATMPIFRINSEPPFRDISSFKTTHHRNLALDAIEMRRKFSLYYYTILTNSEPLIRPMFYEFYTNTITFQLDEQYMIGESLLIAHPFLPESSLIKIYLPPEGEVFYEYFSGKKYSRNDLGWINLTCRPSDWFIFIRGGYIITLLEKETLNLLIALSDEESNGEDNKNFKNQKDPVNNQKDKNQAVGSVHLLNDVELNFTANETTVTVFNIEKFQEVFCKIEQKEEIPTNISFTFYGKEEQPYNSLNNEDLCSCEINECVFQVL